MYNFLKRYPSVLLLSFCVFLLDQWSKLLILRFVPLTSPPTVIFNIFEDFFQIIHVRNTGTLFSLGSRWSFWKNLLFLKIFPLILIIWITLVVSIPYDLYKKVPVLRWIPYEKFDTQSRWILAIVIGGGLGNIIDRFFRPHGVIDFLDFKFYGIFGLERWPTFNVADVSVIIGMSLLVLISISSRKKLSFKNNFR